MNKLKIEYVDIESIRVWQDEVNQMAIFKEML